MSVIALIIGWAAIIAIALGILFVGMCLVTWAVSDAKWMTKRERRVNNEEQS